LSAISALEIEKMQLDEIRKDLNDEFRIVEGATFERLRMHWSATRLPAVLA
jgi:hypothetical protein